jgi:hypothetical protein
MRNQELKIRDEFPDFSFLTFEFRFVMLGWTVQPVFFRIPLALALLMLRILFADDRNPALPADDLAIAAHFFYG